MTILKSLPTVSINKKRTNGQFQYRYPSFSKQIIGITLGFCFLLHGELSGCQTAGAATLDLSNLQVFASGSISGKNSDFQGVTAAGDTISLDDFDIDGDLVARNGITFNRGRVHGEIRAAHRRLNQVSADFGFAVHGAAWDAAAHQMDAIDRHVSTLSATVQPIVAHLWVKGLAQTVIWIEASHGLDVIDVPSEWLRSDPLHAVRVVVSGDARSELVIRIRGLSPILKNVAFSTLGGITPSQVIFAFPEAKDLVIASSGGAVDQDGKNWGVPGSILASHASLRMGAVKITGRVFARDISTVVGLPSSQINRIEQDIDRPSVLTELTSPSEQMDEEPTKCARTRRERTRHIPWCRNPAIRGS